MMCGEQHAKCRARAFLAAHRNVPTVIAHNAMHHGEAHARAFAHRLGGEERFKDAMHDFLWNARACVRHANLDVFTAGQMIRQTFLHMLQPERQRAATSAHGIGRVRREVHKHLMELDHVAEHLHVASIVRGQ